MRQINRSEAPLFQVRNHHSATSGQSPHIDDLRPNQYLGYFENEHREQVVFVYDRDSDQGILYLATLAGRLRTRWSMARCPI